MRISDWSSDVCSSDLRLAAQALDPARGIVATKRGQVDATDRLHQPRRLVFLLYRTPRRQAGRAAVAGVAVDAQVTDPVQIERTAVVAAKSSGLRSLQCTHDSRFK